MDCLVLSQALILETIDCYRIGNFRILSLTLATRHQNLQYYLIKENAFLSETLECGPGEISCALNRISYTYSHALNDCDSNCFLFFFVERLPSEIYLFI